MSILGSRVLAVKGNAAAGTGELRVGTSLSHRPIPSTGRVDPAAAVKKALGCGYCIYASMPEKVC